jgi:hypothetical protein
MDYSPCCEKRTKTPLKSKKVQEKKSSYVPNLVAIWQIYDAFKTIMALLASRSSRSRVWPTICWGRGQAAFHFSRGREHGGPQQ